MSGDGVLALSAADSTAYNDRYKNYWQTYQNNATSGNYSMPTSFYGNRRSAEEESSGCGWVIPTIILAGAATYIGIRCHNNGFGEKVWDRIKSGFSRYKDHGLRRQLTDKGVVDKLPEGATLRTGTFIHKDNKITFAGDTITHFENKNGEDLTHKFDEAQQILAGKTIESPTCSDVDKEYIKELKEIVAKIRKFEKLPKEVNDLTYTSAILNNDGKKTIYRFIEEEGENQGKWQVKERTKRWFS